MRDSSLFIATCVVLAGCSAQVPRTEPVRVVVRATAPEVEDGMAEMTAPEPPSAARRPHRLEMHGDVRTDEYYWLRERDNPEVIAYLEAENAYTASILAHTEKAQSELYDEIVGRIKKDDSTVPYRLDDYFYYERFEEGGEYPIYCRRRGSLEGPEEVILDVNRRAEGHEHMRVRGVAVSPEHDVLAWAEDTVGRRLYTLRFRDLATGADLPDVISDITGNHAWANDNKTLFYTRQHPETLRWYRIYKHVLGTDQATDELVYEEADEEFSTYVFKTKSRRFLVIGSSQTLADEYRVLEADDPTGEFRVFLPREEGHEHSIEHRGEEFLIRTNWEAPNFRLMATGIDATGRESWRELVGHRSEVFFDDLEIFGGHLVLAERHEGLIRMRVMPSDGTEEHYVDFGEPAYLAFFDDNPELDSTVLRYGYSSLTTPWSVYDYDLTSRAKTLRKQDEVLGDFSPDDYVSERLWATARDGARVPISIVYRRGFERTGDRPLLLYAYGSYGYSLDATFDVARLSLLDRGFAYAIAHVRGGQELGRSWYEDGKLLAKKNTFTDFIDCARFLVAEGYTSPERLFAMGGSAGGLLMGAVANQAPELFRGIVSRVPFVDVVTTMLDESIPLTTSEYDEWGDPNEKVYYDYIRSYSPYDNLVAQDYPDILVTAGLHDSQVQYWEPAKYVAKLRSLDIGDALVLLKTEMEAGHSGASGRFKRFKETALAWAFLLDLAASGG